MFINTGKRWINLDNVTEINTEDDGSILISYNTGAWTENGQSFCFGRTITDQAEIDRILWALEGQMKAL